MLRQAAGVPPVLKRCLHLQQMRFGGNIGVHAINRTSAAPLNNPTQQLMQPPGGVLGGQGMGPMGNMGGMGGLGALSAMNNPLGGLPGAPRPAIRPPNWQRTQALAQQAAQAQAQQQVGTHNLMHISCSTVVGFVS